MENESKTCGDLYLEGIRRFGQTDEAYWGFVAGFVSGQAEKVYNRVCPAAMFRPSQHLRDKLLRIIDEVIERYDLSVSLYDNEVWIYRGDGRDAFYAIFIPMMSMNRESPAWHQMRAVLCGIPWDNVDLKYHERKNFNQPCDQFTHE